MTRSKASLAIALVVYAALVLGAAGCANIPPATVQLNQEVGKAIIAKQQAYRNLLDMFFAARRAQVDSFIYQEYLPAYLANLKRLAAAQGHKGDCLPLQALRPALKEVSKYRDELINALEDTKTLILQKAQKEHELVLSANNQVTSLLQSAVRVQEAQDTLAKSIGAQTGLEVDLAAVRQTTGEFLIKAGKAAKMGTGAIQGGSALYDDLKKSLNK